KFSRLGEKNIVCISGVGNNGGGVISAARHITCFGGKPTLILLKSKKFISNSSKFHLFITRRNKRIQTTCVNKNSFKKILLLIKNSDIIIDGIFGTGFQNEIHDPIYTIITQMNKSKAHIISNDVPSGINADTGISANISVNSDFIIALHKPKKGILNSKIKFKIVDIGIPPEIDSPSKGVIA
ncbi:MAG: NAD(P)H-hydrate epimerase, partial [Nitrosopumilales archaeon CG11_big_fil_rev_8_21_14_0_20_33_24]